MSASKIFFGIAGIFILVGIIGAIVSANSYDTLVSPILIIFGCFSSACLFYAIGAIILQLEDIKEILRQIYFNDKQIK